MTAVTIVMTYYNRSDQLRLTLRSFRAFYGINLPGIQVIIVDDGSNPSSTARQVLAEENFDATLIEISPQDKTWTNPCVPFNRGFAAATGDIVFIQNAESLHMGPILNCARSIVNQTNYVVFPCYSTTQEQLHKLVQLHNVPDVQWYQEVQKVLEPTLNDQWYHHPTQNPTWYHFASAMTRDNLRGRLGGFNEAFANGYCFEDNEFLLRIRRSGLKIPVINPNQGYVAHLWHPKNPALHGGCPLWEKNRKLYLSTLEGRG
ncbi:MAG: glycosyltransferase [Sphaerochaetaceae bacterium]|nr:glycosyltransferase [Sphaerochaetaceae bacterium]